MLFVNTEVIDVITICISAVIGIFGVATAMNGYLFKKIIWPFRVLFAVGGLTLLIPGLVTDIIGLVLVAPHGLPILQRPRQHSPRGLSENIKNSPPEAGSFFMPCA